MMKFILPLLLVVLGVGGGAAAGFFLKPAPVEVVDEDGTHDCLPSETTQRLKAVEVETPSELEYVKLNNQFVIPVLKSGRVAALVILSLSVEVSGDQDATVYEREPKLRDLFNEVLFFHANTGGFDGVFTDFSKMEMLRKGLSEAAHKALGGTHVGVLITDIVRQDA